MRYDILENISENMIRQISAFYLEMHEKNIKYNRRQIADELEVSPSTISKYISYIYNSKDVNSTLNRLYRIVMLHTCFKTDDVYYCEQQEILKEEKKERVKQMVLSVHNKRKGI